MSEYQYVGFRAIDRPVSEKNLAFMRRQSTRAEITPWSFNNEYHYGDFHGDAVEMLRRGYDIHLHYANFGIRKLLIRFPQGLANASSLKPYVEKDSLQLVKDKQGSGRILVIQPFHESGDLDELWDIDAILDRLVPLRAEILNGDLRPLYLAHLAIACDGDHDPEEAREAPVPAGLQKLSRAQCALAELYGLGDELIAAATKESPSTPDSVDDASLNQYADWLRSQAETTKNTWLAALMVDHNSAIRAELLEKYRADRGAPTWLTNQPKRAISELRAIAVEIASRKRRKADEKSAREKSRRFAKMAVDPTTTLRETEQLILRGTSDAYRQAVELLAELREALSASDRSDMAEEQAQKLKANNPTRRLLIRELRRHGFVS